MSTGIGDYIHYHRSRYEKFGISKDNKTNFSHSAVLDEARKKLVELHSGLTKKANWEPYEKFLTELIWKGNAQNNLEGFTLKHFEDATKNFFQQGYPDIEAGIEEILASVVGSSKDSGFVRKSASKNLKKNRKGEYQTSVQRKSVINQSQKLKQISKELKLLLRNDNYKNKYNEIKKFKQEIESYILVLEKIKKEMELVSSKSRAIKTLQIRTSKFDENSLTVAGKMWVSLNDIVSRYNKFIFDTALSGASGEAVIAAASMVGGIVAVKNLKNITDVITARDKYNNLIDISSFGSNINSSRFLKHLNVKNNFKLDENFIISPDVTQGTVDISITLEDKSFLQEKMGINQFNASVKNYSNPNWHGVSLVKGVPLLTILMLIDSGAVNHYLNLLGSRPFVEDSSTLEKYNEVIQYASAVRGLLGVRDKSFAASNSFSDCFILNNKAKSRVEVYSSDELLKKIDINPNLVKVKGLPKRIPTSWIGDKADKINASYRIEGLIARTHLYKLEVSLTPKILKD